MEAGFGSQADEECAVLTSSGEICQAAPLALKPPPPSADETKGPAFGKSPQTWTPQTRVVPQQQPQAQQQQQQQQPQWWQRGNVQAPLMMIPNQGYPSMQPVPSSPRGVGVPRPLPSTLQPPSPSMGFRWTAPQPFVTVTAPSAPPRQSSPSPSSAPVMPNWWQVSASPRVSAAQVPQQIRKSVGGIQSPRSPMASPRLLASSSPPAPFSAVVKSPTFQNRGLLQKQNLERPLERPQERAGPSVAEILESVGVSQESLQEGAEQSKKSGAGAAKDDQQEPSASKLVSTLANVLLGLEADIDLLRRENQDLRERERHQPPRWAMTRPEHSPVQQLRSTRSTVPLPSMHMATSSQPALAAARSGHSSPVAAWRPLGMPPMLAPVQAPGSPRSTSPVRTQVVMPGFVANVASSPMLGTRSVLGGCQTVVPPVVPVISGLHPASVAHVGAGEVPSPPPSARVPGPGNTVGTPIVPPSPTYPGFPGGQANLSGKFPIATPPSGAPQAVKVPLVAPARPAPGTDAADVPSKGTPSPTPQTPSVGGKSASTFDAGLAYTSAGGNPYASTSGDASGEGNGIATDGITSAPPPAQVISPTGYRGRPRKDDSLPLDAQTEKDLQLRQESLHAIEDFARRGDANRAEEVLWRTLRGGLQPAEGSYDAVIGAFHRAGDTAKAEEWLWRMIQQGLSPSEANFDAVISSAARAGQASKAEAALLQMMRLQLRPSKSIFDLVIGAFCDKKDPAKAEVWMLNAGQSGWTPEAATFQALVVLWAEQDCDKAEEWLKRTLQSGVEPSDDRCFNAVIEAFARLGAQGALKAEEWLTRCTEGGREISEHAYGETVAALAMAGEVSKAERRMQKMEDQGMSAPHHNVRASLFDAAIRIGDVEAAERQLQTMSPDAPQHEKLLCTHAEHGNVAQAEALLEHLRGAGVVASMDTFHKYLGACAAVADASRAEACFREMVSVAQPPIDVASVEPFIPVLQQALGADRGTALLTELGLVAPPPPPEPTTRPAPKRGAPKRSSTAAVGTASGKASPRGASSGRGRTLNKRTTAGF